MLRRRAAEWAGRGLRSLLEPAGAAATGGKVQQSLASGGSCISSSASVGSSSGSSSSWRRWRHLGAAAGRRVGGSGGSGSGGSSAAARAATRQQQKQGQGAASAWRVSSWQQVRQRWSDGRGYQHFGGRGRQGYSVLYSAEARTRAVKWVVVIGAGGAVVWVSSRQEVPYTLRTHAILVGPDSEHELGTKTYQQVLLEARSEGTLLPPNHPAVLAVRRVGLRIAQAATDGYGGGFQGHLKDMAWEFAVINSPQVNAFVVPGGKVVVYSGLLRMVANEDELASVLAHESAHVVARHAAERITQMGAVEVARMVAYWVFGLPIPAGPLSAIFFLPNSRKAETEADVIGLQIMARACYDPSAMVSMFEKMGHAEAAEGGDRMPKFLRTHPLSSDRVKAIQKMLPTAEGLYDMSGCEAARGPLMQFRSVLQRLDWGR